MSQQIIEHVVCPEGRFWRETRTRQEIDPGPAFEKAFSKPRPVKIPNVLDIPGYGPVGMCQDDQNNATYWSVPIQFINLRCEFRPVEDAREGKILVPKFIYEDGSKEVITIKWTLTGDYGQTAPSIVLLIKNAPTGDNLYTEQQWLFAFNTCKNVYQLPMANLFNHLAICAGKYDAVGRTHLECIKKALTQFESSPWNSDLYHNNMEEGTANFFRFRPEKDGFTTLPINSDNWTKLCQKRSTQFTEYVV
jgi:hypothetical protein